MNTRVVILKILLLAIAIIGLILVIDNGTSQRIKTIETITLKS